MHLWRRKQHWHQWRETCTICAGLLLCQSEPWNVSRWQSHQSVKRQTLTQMMQMISRCMDACPFHSTPLRNTLEFCVRAAVDSLIGPRSITAQCNSPLTVRDRNPQRCIQRLVAVGRPTRNQQASTQKCKRPTCRIRAVQVLQNLPLWVPFNLPLTRDSYVRATVTQDVSPAAACSAAWMRQQEVCALVSCARCASKFPS
jgi:hypothetical protein